VGSGFSNGISYSSLMRTTREEDVPRLVPKIRGSDLTAGEQRAGPGIVRQAEWVEPSGSSP
jgi:hypothetical protein